MFWSQMSPNASYLALRARGDAPGAELAVDRLRPRTTPVSLADAQWQQWPQGYCVNPYGMAAR
jgi:hypothetical protein